MAGSGALSVAAYAVRTISGKRLAHPGMAVCGGRGMFNNDDVNLYDRGPDVV